MTKVLQPLTTLPPRYRPFFDPDSYINDIHDRPVATCMSCAPRLNDYETKTVRMIPKKHTVRTYCLRCNWGKSYLLPTPAATVEQSFEEAFTAAFKGKKNK